ncbi:hypothetical protein HZI73_13575 [Vallitalea pronyensis]|uniref:Uncharacterized protein n=1 Tax=Vallitalea pronyensis TaxID=1348613 RepID=A0A8J8MK14_9FIRM|nr:hypothetical protein [Vallitalea pronyensis]QUI23252.1 hypothetical protein HZI73_13575 [Vallitalea pronyensis]
MSIKPLDMQVMIPKTQKVASIRHLEQQKAHVNQDQIAQTVKQQVKDKNQQVIKSNENEKFNNEADARKKGKNTYHGKRNGKHKNKKESGKSPSRHHIDIRI